MREFSLGELNRLDLFYYLNNLKELIEISDRIRIDRLKDMLDLPIALFIDNLSIWVKQFGFSFDKDFVNFEKESLSKQIELLDNKFLEWKEFENKNIKNSSIAQYNNLKTPFKDENTFTNSDLVRVKFKLLENLANLGDPEAQQIFKGLNILLNSSENRAFFLKKAEITIWKEELSVNDLFKEIMKKYDLKSFLNLYNRVMSHEKISNIGDPFRHRTIDLLLRESSDTHYFLRLFYEKTKITPLKIIKIENYIFYVLSTSQDFMKVKPILPSIKRELFKKTECQVILLHNPRHLVELLIDIFENEYVGKMIKEYNEAKETNYIIVSFIDTNRVQKIDNEKYVKVVQTFFKEHVFLTDFNEPTALKIRLESPPQ